MSDLKSLTDRVIILIDLEKSSDADFARKIGCTRPIISQWRAGSAKVSSNTLISIAKAYPNLNLRWLIEGAEPMFFEEYKIPELDLQQVQEGSSNQYVSEIRRLRKEIVEKEIEISTCDLVIHSLKQRLWECIDGKPIV